MKTGGGQRVFDDGLFELRLFVLAQRQRTLLTWGESSDRARELQSPSTAETRETRPRREPNRYALRIFNLSLATRSACES